MGGGIRRCLFGFVYVYVYGVDMGFSHLECALRVHTPGIGGLLIGLSGER